MVAGRKLDSLWDHAIRSDKGFKCRFCSKDFKGGVVRLRYHLSGVSGGGIHICSNVSEEAKNAALLSLNAVNKKRKIDPSSSDSDGGSSEICDANCNSEVGYSLAKFFLIAGINHNMVESSSFTSLIKALSPGSALPSSVELESKLIPSYKTEVEQYVSDAKKSWIETGCTLIPIFELNEKEGRSFLSIFGCAKERTVLLNTFEVPINTDLVDPFLEETVHSVAQSVGSLNIVQCVVDGSKYGESFSKLLYSKYPHVCLTNCVAHEVQLMFDEICRDVGWVRTTFTVIKSIVDYICTNTAILALMSKYANGRELKQSLDLNLLSSYKMLESILEMKEHLVQLVRSPEWLASGYGAGQRGSEATTYIEDPKTWEWGEKLQKGLRSLSQALCSVDFHDSSSGYLYGLMEIVEHSISQLWKNNQDMYQRFWDIYRLKKGKILSEFHIAAAFLNPAYMHTEQAKNVDTNPVISYIMGRFIAEGDREFFVNEVYEYRKILSDGSKLYETTAAKTYHPCQWWETFGQNLPILRNLAIRISSHPCSTSTCKRSMRTVEAVLVKEQRELARGITDLDLKMNAILLERFSRDRSCERGKIVLEEFIKQMSNNGESTSRPLRQLKLCFMTLIASHIRTSQNVEGEKGCRIHVFLEDPTTGRVVQNGIPSTLPLTISVLDGHFSNEASSEEHSTREYFNRNELLGEFPYITGDLGVTLIRGEGTLGNFSFNYSSVNRESGQFRLAVKTHTGVCGGFRILEGISNPFTVEDAEEVSPEIPIANVDPQNGSFSSNPGEYWDSNIDPLIENEYGFPLGQWFDTPYYPLQGSDQSLAQRAARRVKKKALTWQLQSRGRRRTLKRGSEALKRKSRGEEEVLEAEREVYSTGSNNINGQEIGEENDEAMRLEEVDSLSCCSTSGVARESISLKPESSSMTLFGVRVAASSSGAEPIRETPPHPSTGLQLSTSARGNNVYHQKEDGKAMTLKDFVPQLHSTSIKKMKVSRCKEQVFTAMHLPKDTTSSCVQGEMSHRLSCDLMENSDQVYHASMIGDLHDVIGQKTRQAHIRWLKVKAVMIWWTVVRRAAARRRTIQHEGGEEDDVHKSTTMSIRETPAHPSTALQLSISTSANNVNQQKEDGEAVALKDFDPQMHSTSIKKRKGQWWETFGEKLPNLRNLAIRISSQPCSTSPCKRSMRTVEAVLVKEQRELARGITDLDLKMNPILMERFNKDKSCEREKVVLEEFSKQMSNNGESTSRPLRQFKLCFVTAIASPICTSQNVEGEKGRRIHICLEDPSTGRVVQDGLPSTLPLTISLLDGHFSNEASSEEHSTREYFSRNELLGECPYITGDLGLTLIRGEGTLGNFSFNYSSVNRESGQFRLAVKTHTGVCGGFRILEGISNAFTVEDGREEDYVHKPTTMSMEVRQHSTMNQQEDRKRLKEDLMHMALQECCSKEDFPLHNSDIAQGSISPMSDSLAATHIPLQITTNNINGQEIGEENDEAMGLEEVDSLSCCSTSGVARDFVCLKPEVSAMTLLGVRVAASSSGAEPIRETPAHPSTALQLSISTRANNVNQHKIVQHHKHPPLVLTEVGCSVGVCCNDLQQWQNQVLQLSEGSYSPVDTKSKIFHCLEKSLNDLSSKHHELKERFMDLLSLFPEDPQIPTTVLIDIWEDKCKLGPDGVNVLAIIHNLLNRNLVHLRCTREYKCLDNGYFGDMYVSQHNLLWELAIQLSNQEPIENRERIYIDIRNNKFQEWLMEGKKAQKARLMSICTDKLFSSCWPNTDFPAVEVRMLNVQTIVENLGKMSLRMSSEGTVKVRHLKGLQISSCSSTLKKLEDGICQLKKLRKIYLRYCHNLTELPHSQGDLENLMELNPSYCSYRTELPHSLGDLENLLVLSVSSCSSLQGLPDSISALGPLEHLDLSNSFNISRLPDSISALRPLEHLDLSNSFNISRLLPQFGELMSLKVSKMDGCYGLCALPSSVINLEELEHVICDQETAFLWRNKRLDKRIVIEVKEEKKA